MKKLVAVATMAIVSTVAYADDSGIRTVKSYEGLLREGAFSCKLKKDLYDSSVSLRGVADTDSRAALSNCISDFSNKARTGLPDAVKAASTDAMKAAVKNMYTEWQAYIGHFDPPGQARFERARSALDTELLVSQ